MSALPEGGHLIGCWEDMRAHLARQELPLLAEYTDEIIGHRPHTRNFRKVAADQEPHVALGQAFSERDLHKATIIGATYRGRSATP